jgi:hypothetical protein
MDWRCVSHGRTPAFQAESPEFQPLILQQKITLFFTLCNRIMKNLKHTKEEVALKGLRLRAVSLCSLWRLSIFRTRSVPRSSRASEPHCAPHQAIRLLTYTFPEALPELPQLLGGRDAHSVRGTVRGKKGQKCKENKWQK